MLVGRVERIRQDIDTEEFEFLIDIESGDEESSVAEKSVYRMSL